MVIGESPLTQRYLDDARLLIGCPKHESGAIGDRLREGGESVAYAKHWILISMPDR